MVFHEGIWILLWILISLGGRIFWCIIGDKVEGMMHDGDKEHFEALHVI